MQLATTTHLQVYCYSPSYAGHTGGLLQSIHVGVHDIPLFKLGRATLHTRTLRNHPLICIEYNILRMSLAGRYENHTDWLYVQAENGMKLLKIILGRFCMEQP